MKVSIIICCYNSSAKIDRVLEHILALDTIGIEVEVIVVNNACIDDTVNRVKVFMHNNTIPIRIVDEMCPGLSYARETGWRSATGDFILYCDDDNWLATNYLIRAKELFSKLPEVAALGGLGIAVADSEIPDWFFRYQTSYACGHFFDSSRFVDQLTGAGLIIRRDALKNLFLNGFSFLLSDRKGSSLSSGGDGELTLALSLCGWKLFWDPALKFKHYMPESRLIEGYAIKLYYSFGQANPIMYEYRRALAVKRGTNLRFADRLPVWARAASFWLRNVLNNLISAQSLDARLKVAATQGASDFYYESLKSGSLLIMRRKIARNLLLLDKP